MAKNVFRRAFKTLCLSITLLLVLLFLVACLSPYVNPANWWLNGFTGLIVPYLVLLLFFAMIFWLIVKPVVAWLPFLSLCLGWQQFQVVFAWHAGSGFNKRKHEQNLRLIDWNVQSFNGLTQNKETRRLIRTDVAESILKLQPDIICLQEFNTSLSSVDNIALFTKTHPYYYFSKDYLRNKGDYLSGSIIFSKYPIIDTGRVAYPVA